MVPSPHASARNLKMYVSRGTDLWLSERQDYSRVAEVCLPDTIEPAFSFWAVNRSGLYHLPSAPKLVDRPPIAADSRAHRAAGAAPDMIGKAGITQGTRA